MKLVAVPRFEMDLNGLYIILAEGQPIIWYIKRSNCLQPLYIMRALILCFFFLRGTNRLDS